MSEITDLAVIEITPDQAPALYITNGLDAYLEQIRQSVNEVPDLTTKKGRDRVASLAAQVSRSKTAIEKPGRAYLKRLKEAVKPAEAEIKRFVDACDELRDATRRPLTEWEEEQERIKAEEAMTALHVEALAMDAEFDRKREAQIESDHEIALLMNDKFDRDREEQRRQAEQAQREHEELIKQQATTEAIRETEEKARRERQQHQDALSEISGIQQQVIIAQSGRAGVRQGGTIQCIKDTLEETVAWTIDERFGSLMGTAENAKRQAIEQIKQLLINAENIQKQQQENDRIRQEAEAKEAARIAEEKRIADEAARREADVKHRKAVGTGIVNALTGHTSISREQAIEVLRALMAGDIPNAVIHY
ncbi:hypothetical protein RJ492_004119 [Pluralibacter gergoviae]|uniref:Uncharacterized protein n=1 Tax=Pluralibacter gergoviae TaxID=61647 RepID=A0AAI9DNA0_PLUGE|nr:hypothetical protein [Pluralibacter gergoviae]EKV9910101.1 hypothetical protein [Pluralibacter gergoviae]EKW7275006.1 hypothetical protein [Pluralibacter gergoviae]ELD4297406.1 hypothetical protein [Pluralibacter gergoviae]ELD4308153.1 hypothetical protein [Pluralibacter gergoviae]